MLWMSLFGLALIVISTAVLPMKLLSCCEPADSNNNLFNIEKPRPLVETAKSCEEILQSFETQKQQLHHRLEMLDELIEKSDREIVRMQEQLGRMDNIRAVALTDTDHEMLSLLQAGGYDTGEIARLTQRDMGEIDRAA